MTTLHQKITTNQSLGIRRLISTWIAMIDRCYNPCSIQYKNYGGRGIQVCDRWLDKSYGLINFIQDMGIKPPKYTLERVDNSKGYFPENCKWVTNTTNQRNKRNNKIIEYKGELYVLAKLCEIKNLNLQLVARRIQRGWDVERAIDQPGIGTWQDYLNELERKRNNQELKEYHRLYRQNKKIKNCIPWNGCT